MARLTVLVAVLLILLGGSGYFASGRASVTALIPAAFGAVLLVLGLAALRESYRKHAMHAASLVALLGLIGALMRPLRAAAAGEFELSLAVASQILMALICGVYLAFCVRSFMLARLR